MVTPCCRYFGRFNCNQVTNGDKKVLPLENYNVFLLSLWAAGRFGMYYAGGLLAARHGCEGEQAECTQIFRASCTAHRSLESDKPRGIVPFFALLCLSWQFLLPARTSRVIFSGNEKKKEAEQYKKTHGWGERRFGEWDRLSRGESSRNLAWCSDLRRTKKTEVVQIGAQLYFFLP